MSLAIATPNKWAQVQHGLRRVAPYLLFAALATVVWWAGAWLLPLALFAVACWRGDPQQIRGAVELLAGALVLALTAVALLVQCARGSRMTYPATPRGPGPQESE